MNSASSGVATGPPWHNTITSPRTSSAASDQASTSAGQSFSVSADGGVRVDTEVSGPRQYTFHLVRDTKANGPASIVFKAGAESYRVPVDATASP